MKIVLYLFGVLALVSCANYAGFKTQLASESLVEQMVFCNPIRTAEGFNGVIAVNTNENNWVHQTESTILQFKDVPDVFKTIPHSYIQLFPFNYTNNRLRRGCCERYSRVARDDCWWMNFSLIYFCSIVLISL